LKCWFSEGEGGIEDKVSIEGWLYKVLKSLYISVQSFEKNEISMRALTNK